MFELTIPGKPVPKCTMTTKQIKLAFSGKYEGSKSKQILDLFNFQDVVAWGVKQQRMRGERPLKGYVKITIKIYLYSENKEDLPVKRGDLDNYVKSIVDGLQYGGLFAPRDGDKKGNDKMVVRYGEGTGIYITNNPNDERIEVTAEDFSFKEDLKREQGKTG